MAGLTLCADSTTAGGTSLTGVIWKGWNIDHTATGTATTWYAWNPAWSGTTTLTATATTDIIWYGWNDDYLRYVRLEPVETAEQRQAREQSALEAERKRTVIHERAEKWLRQHLNQQQEDQYLKDREFVVYSRDRRRRYLITAKDAWVYELNEAGKRIRSFCIHSRPNGGSLPIADEICVKKLLLESDEESFLKIANATRLAA